MFWRKKTSQQTEASGNGRQRAERLPTAILWTDLGPVLDLSRSGLRLSMDRKPPIAIGTEVDLSISSARETFAARAKLARTTHMGSGRYELGLAFVGLSEDDRTALELLAKTGSTRPGLSDPKRKEKLIAALRAPDHYAALGITRAATSEDVQAGYRAMARKFHPDVNTAPDAASRFVQITEAYAVLNDAEKRAEYDELYALKNAA